MTLANIYSISVRHQRSARIDTDLTAAFFDGFVYHGTAQETVESLIRQYSQTNQSNFTLTGSYGSGKSTIALLLMGLLDHSKKITLAADAVLTPQSRQIFAEHLPNKKGWLQIRSVGGVKNPIETFWEATLSALEYHPNTQEAFIKYQTKVPLDEANLIKIWKELFLEISEKVDGVLLIADEMGKSLEYINRTGGQLHLFQEIPEIISRLKIPFLFLGLLHQSFSEYAKDRGSKLQEEWGKIQGRYQDFNYNVSTDETVALIAKSISVKNENNGVINSAVVDATLNAVDDTSERKKLLKHRLLKCLPLHPLVALLLGPISKRRFSQNERSTFAFLNSYEIYGLQQFLKSTTDTTKLYRLPELWDYLETNLEHLILSSSDAHAWAEAAEVVRRSPQEKPAQYLIKSIALLNLFGNQANLSATDALLQVATELDQKAVKNALETLENASCIVFRKHQSQWVVFEGSDLDITAELKKKVEQLTDSNEALDHIIYNNQIIAKRHYHESGTLRWVNQNICLDLFKLESDLKKIKQHRKGAFADFVLLLKKPELHELELLINKENDIAVATASNIDDIKAYATEIYALDLLKSDTDFGKALQHDKVAAREFASRYNTALKLLWYTIEESFRHSTWYFHGQKTHSHNLSFIASELADQIYKSSPNILNELVNRNKLSGTAVAARKKLLEAMVESSHKERLGFEGYPPEASMYSSCLKITGLHKKIDEKWQFTTDSSSKQLRALFEHTDNYLNENAGKTINLAEIEASWSSSPFGITAGAFPILLFAYLKALGNKITFYERSISGQMAFLAEPDIDYVHKLQKNVKDLAIKFVVLNENEKAWLQHLATFTSGLTTKAIKNDLLSIAKPLVTLIHNLPYWVKNASNLHENSTQNKLILRVRDLFMQVNDPYALLIEDLPSALKSKNTKDFPRSIEELAFCFKVLMERHEIMLSQLDQQIRVIFPYEKSQLIEMCDLIEKKAGDLRLKAFARELKRSQSSTNKHNNWLESLIAIVIGRNMNSWNQSNLLDAQNKIHIYAQDFLQLVKGAGSENVASNKTLNTKTVSLVLEDHDGKLINYRKEIHISDPIKINSNMENVTKQLVKLTDFERIEVLQNLLKQALEEQG